MPIGQLRLNLNNSAISPESIASNAECKELQNQISNKRQMLNKLSNDYRSDSLEKEEKRRKLQEEITELNRKLSLSRMKQEQEEKKQAKQDNIKDAMESTANGKLANGKLANDKYANDKHVNDKHVNDKHVNDKPADVNSSDTKRQTENENEINSPKNDKTTRDDMSVADIQKMLSVDAMIQKEKIQSQIEQKESISIDILETEIDLDKLHGSDTKKKEDLLDSMLKKEDHWKNSRLEITSKQNEFIPTGKSTKFVAD